MKTKLDRGVIGYRYSLGHVFIGKFVGDNPHYAVGSNLFGWKLYFRFKRKPFIKSLVFWYTILSLLNLTYVPFALIFTVLYIYFNGMIRFMQDSCWVEHVREFTWISFIGFIICLVTLIIKCLF